MSTIIAQKTGTHIEVDDNDFSRANQFHWWVRKDGYAQAKINGRFRLMHRFIMDEHEVGIHVDHIDGNRLNNRKDNLRRSTAAQNMRNKKVTTRSTTGFRGVYECDKTKNYIADITVDGIRHDLGRYNTPEEAAIARDKAAERFHGEFAYYNNKENLGKEVPHDIKHKKTSAYRGVYYHEKKGLWLAEVRKDKVIFPLGEFSDEEDAAKAIYNWLKTNAADRLNWKSYRTIQEM